MNAYLKMLPNFYIKEPVYVKELTAAILTEMILYSSKQKRGNIKYPVCPEYLIRKHCSEKLYPALRKEKEGREITRILRRTFEGFYKIFNDPKCRNFFLPIQTTDESGKEKERPIYFELVEQNGTTQKGQPHPTSKNWKTSKFIVHYGGIKPRMNTEND